MKNDKNIIIGLLVVIIVILAILVVLFATNTLTFNFGNNSDKLESSNEIADEENKDETIEEKNITIEDLYGTYSWNKTYTNEYNNTLNLKVKLILNADGSATYEAGDGYSYESTKGTFVYENNKIIYTKEYYNYNGTNGQENDSKYTDGNNTETFIVINENTLQNVYRDQTTSLTK